MRTLLAFTHIGRNTFTIDTWLTTHRFTNCFVPQITITHCAEAYAGTYTSATLTIDTFRQTGSEMRGEKKTMSYRCFKGPLNVVFTI